MAYKKSRYNIEIKDLGNGDMLLFNSLTCALGKMDKDTKDFLEKNSTYSAEEIIQHIGMDNFAALSNNGFIIDDGISELELLKIRSQNNKFDSDILALTIAPTLDCNMRCPYCFEEKQNVSMDEHVTAGLVNFVKKYLEGTRCRKMHVTWYGGEPLLELEKIVELSEAFIAICNTLNVKYSSYIITNGVLLTRETAHKLNSKCMVSGAQITVDGSPEFHNKRRILVNGDNSYEIIMDNIDKCKDILNIAVRMNVDSGNFENVYQLIDELIDKRKWGRNPQFYFAIAEDYGNTNHFINNTCLASDDFICLTKKYIDKMGSRLNIKELIPKQTFNFCAAVRKNAYVIDPKGNLYKCWNIIGREEMKIGTIIDSNKVNSELLRWIAYEPGDKCLTCNLLPVCMGGCPYKYFEKGEHICDNRLLAIEEKLCEVYRLYCNRNKKLDFQE